MENETELSQPQKDGSTLREQLESAARQRGIPDERLTPVEVPDEVKYLFDWFCELSASRPMGEMGIGSIAYTEMESWARMKRVELAAWEIETIKQMDAAYITQAMRKRNE